MQGITLCKELFMSLFLSAAKYAELYPNFPIPDDEFDGLSLAAYDMLCSLVESRLILDVWVDDWRAKHINATDDLCSQFKKIVAQQVQVLYHANGLQATTGGGDFGQLKIINGIGFGQYAYDALTTALRRAGFIGKRC